MKKSLLVLDLDGTLLRNDKSVSAENRLAVRLAREKGVIVVLATGRPAIGTRSVQIDLDNGRDEYLITYNGALTLNQITGGIIAAHWLTRLDFDRIAAFIRARGLFCYAFSQDTCLAPEWHEIIDIERQVNGIETRLADFGAMPTGEPLYKIMATGTPAGLDEAMAAVPADISADYSIVRSAPLLLEFLHPLASKGQAVRELAGRLSIGRQSIICIGDAGNDADMIRFAGLGVAMGNATDDIRAIADFVTLSNEEHGVARVIRQFLL